MCKKIKTRERKTRKKNEKKTKKNTHTHMPRKKKKKKKKDKKNAQREEGEEEEHGCPSTPQPRTPNSRTHGRGTGTPTTPLESFAPSPLPKSVEKKRAKFLKRARTNFNRMQPIVERWNSNEKVGTQLLQSLSTTGSRLGTVREVDRDPSKFGVLALFHGVGKRMERRHFERMEADLYSLHLILENLEQDAHALRRIADDAAAIGATLEPPTAARPLPSSKLLEWCAEFASLFSEDYWRKHAIISAIELDQFEDPEYAQKLILEWPGCGTYGTIDPKLIELVYEKE